MGMAIIWTGTGTGTSTANGTNTAGNPQGTSGALFGVAVDARAPVAAVLAVGAALVFGA